MADNRGGKNISPEQMAFWISLSFGFAGLLVTIIAALASNNAWLASGIAVSLFSVNSSIAAVMLSVQKLEQRQSATQLSFDKEHHRLARALRVLTSDYEWTYDKLADEIVKAERILMASLSETISDQARGSLWAASKRKIFTSGDKKVDYIFGDQDPHRRRLLDQLCHEAVAHGPVVYEHHPLEGNVDYYVHVRYLEQAERPTPQGNLIILTRNDGYKLVIDIGPDAFDKPERWITAIDPESVARYEDRFRKIWDQALAKPYFFGPSALPSKDAERTPGLDEKSNNQIETKRRQSRDM